MQQNILGLSTDNLQSQSSHEPIFSFPTRKIICYSTVRKHGVKQITFIWAWTEQVFVITTSKPQIISAFLTNCLLVYTLIVVCFEDDASLEFPASLFNKFKTLDEGSVHLKNEFGVLFANLSLCLVPPACEKRAAIPCNSIAISVAQTLHLTL